jgi:formate dehydrogenase iron-sulfur subunit
MAARVSWRCSSANHFTIQTRNLLTAEIIESCPAGDGTLAKCDMGNDRVNNGLKSACVQTCPTGAMQFGQREEILILADKHLWTRGVSPRLASWRPTMSA